MKNDFVKELYLRELDAKRDLDARPTFHVAVLSVLGSLLAYLVAHFNASGRLQASWFVVSIGVAASCYIVGLYHVIRSNLGHWYERLPPVQILEGYWANLETYFEQNPTVSGSAASDFKSFVRRRMVEAASRNEYANLSRAARHYSAMRAMSFCVVFTLLAFAPLLWNARTLQAKVEPTIEADCPPGGTMTDTTKPTSASAPAKPSQPAPPPKPPEPPNTVFRGTQQPPKITTIVPSKAPTPNKPK